MLSLVQPRQLMLARADQVIEWGPCLFMRPEADIRPSVKHVSFVPISL
jgi:hypothetical protein